MRKITAFFIVLLSVLLMIPVTAGAASPTALEEFEYTRNSPGTVLLTQYIGTAQSVTVPGNYMVNGVSCGVQLASQTVFAGNQKLTSVSLSSGVTFTDASMKLLFGKCTALRTVKLRMDTSAVTDMSYVFYGCEALETLDVSSFDTKNVRTMKAMFSNCTRLKKLTGYEKWDTASLRSIAYMFNQTEQLQTIDLSRWSLAGLENSGWCFQKCGAIRILLPEDLAIISAGFFNHVESYEDSVLTIPAGVKKIGYAHTIYNFGTENFKEFRVADGNDNYMAVDGILYSRDGTEMLAIPRGKTFSKGIYTIPEGVTFLGELSFSRNNNIKTVILPDSYILTDIAPNDPAYITFEDTGNLNSGLNLNIAIYSYTGIRNYDVKDSNPNYKSVDGIIYTKDGTKLVAVPTRYEGRLEIPEGTAVWQSAAMWDAGELVDSYMKDCKGVVIPSTMTQIAEDQREKLNRLEDRYSGFRITVHKDNPIYYTGKSGQLLKKSNLEDVEVSLSQSEFVYDGQEKIPELTVSHKGKTLKPEKDYILEYYDNISAGTGWVRITGKGDHYGTVEYSFTIAQAQPEYTAPQNLSAVYGQTLGEVFLPEGFSWMQPDVLVGDTGRNTFAVSYDSGDENYTAVHDISVELLVHPQTVDEKSMSVALWFPWRGRQIKPVVLVANDTGVVSPEEYTCTWENNTHFGTGRLIVSDAPGGNYEVSGTVEFYIVPGPMLCTAVLTLLWCLTTGVSLRKGKKVEQSEKP